MKKHDNEIRAPNSSGHRNRRNPKQLENTKNRIYHSKNRN